MYYRIWIQTPDGANWRELCQCDSIENLLAVLGALLGKTHSKPECVKVDWFIPT